MFQNLAVAYWEAEDLSDFVAANDAHQAEMDMENGANWYYGGGDPDDTAAYVRQCRDEASFGSPGYADEARAECGALWGALGQVASDLGAAGLAERVAWSRLAALRGEDIPF
jgi:hypothetical protein